MATIKVVSPFTVQMEPPPAGPGFEKERETQVPTRTYVFPEAGTYEDVPDDVAEHWYTKSHLEGYKREDMGASTVMKPVEGSGTAAAANPTGTPQSPPAPPDPGAPPAAPQRGPAGPPPEPFDTHDQRESPTPDPQPTGQTDPAAQPQPPSQQPAQPPPQQQQPAQPRPTQPPPKR